MNYETAVQSIRKPVNNESLVGRYMEVHEEIGEVYFMMTENMGH